MTTCGQRTGFLTLTACGEPAVGTCSRCNKSICAGHLQDRPAGPLCPDCAVAGMNAEDASRHGLDSFYYRRSVDSDTSLTSYSPSDYESFETTGGGGGEAGGGGASSDWDDGGDTQDSGDSGGADEGSSSDFQDS